MTAILTLLVATTAFAAEPMTVDRAVEVALANNANVRNARLEIEKGESRVATAKTKRLPALSFNVIGGEALSTLAFDVREGDHTTHVELARTFSMFGIARVTQPITQLHQIGLGIRMNEAAVAVSKEQERAARIALAREVKSAYYAVLSAKGYAAAMNEAVTAWEEVDREMNVRVAQRAVLDADRLDAAARLASTKLAALTAANALASAQDQLDYLVGTGVHVVAPAVDAQISASKDIANRPDVREAELRVEQAKLNVRIQHAESIPDVALTVSNTTPFNNDALPSNMTSAGITMSYEPFTWGRRKAEMTEKRHALEQAENALADRRAAATVEVAVRARKVEETALQIAVRRMESEAAKERLRVTKTKFQEQAARLDEMYSASASLTQAAAREQEAIAAWWTARADYEKAIGEE